MQNQLYIDCRHLDGSGIGTYLENLLRHYETLAPSRPVTLLARRQHISSIRRFSSFKIQIYDAPIYSVREQFNWISKVDRNSIFHVPHYNAPLMFPGELVVTVHDVCHVAMRQFFPGLLKRFYSSYFLQKILEKAQKIITVSNFSRDEIIKYFDIPKEKIKVIYNGVNPHFHPISKEHSDPVLKKHGLPSEYLLFIGNVKPHKNIAGLIYAYQEALDLDPNLPPLVILGQYKNLITGIPNLRKIISETNIRDKIIFTGHLPAEDLPAIYSRAVLFLFPSYYEGFGLPSLEAMACGTPVITSNCSAIPEIVGDAALLIDPYKTQSLTESILKLLGDSELRSQFRSKGLELAKKYSWEKSTLEHLKVFDEIVIPSRNLRRTAAKSFDDHGRKKSILFLDQFGDRIGGGQIILFDVLGKFRESGKWNIYVSIPSEGVFAEKLKDNHFEYWCLPTGKHSLHEGVLTDLSKYVWTSMFSAYYLAKKIRQNKIDVIYCNGGRTFLSGSFLSLFLSVDVFWHLHLILGSRQRSVVRFFGKLPRVRSIIAVSKTLESQYYRDLISDKISVISNWVSPKFVTNQSIIRSSKPDLPLRIGVIGQISYFKGQWTILESLEKSKEQLPITLSFYGEPAQNEEEHWNDLNQKILKLRTNGWIINYGGFKKNVIDIYDNLDLIIIPSMTAEAFGLTAIEAMSRGVIVISNRSGALVEIVEDKKTGFLYNAQNLDELIIILRKIVDQEFDLTTIRRNALERVSKDFHPTRQLEKLYNVVSDGRYVR